MCSNFHYPRSFSFKDSPTETSRLAPKARSSTKLNTHTSNSKAFMGMKLTTHTSNSKAFVETKFTTHTSNSRASIVKHPCNCPNQFQVNDETAHSAHKARSSTKFTKHTSPSKAFIVKYSSNFHCPKSFQGHDERSGAFAWTIVGPRRSRPPQIMAGTSSNLPHMKP